MTNTQKALCPTIDMRAGRLLPYGHTESGLRWRIRRTVEPPLSFPRIAQALYRNIDHFFLGIL